MDINVDAIKNKITDFFKKNSFIFWSVLAVVLGILTGLLFGERCQICNFIGNLYISFMQWVIVPYFFISIIYSLGRFHSEQFLKICKYGIVTYLFSYLIFFIIFVIVPYTFPHWNLEHFSTVTDVSATTYLYEGINFAEMLFLNPIRALAENQIISVVVFSAFFGIILQQQKTKNNLLSQLSVIDEILFQITNLVTKVTPVGLYFLVAYMAGTMSLNDIAELQVFIAVMVVVNALIFFVVCPLMLMMFTPFTYKEIMKSVLPATMIAFLTSNKIIVIPFLFSGLNELFNKYEQATSNTKDVFNIILPIVMIIPSIPRITSYIYILYAAWINNVYISFLEHIKMYFLALLSSFATVNIGIPFVLSQFKLPADMFQLYIVCDTVFVDKLRTGCEVMAIFICTAIIVLFYNKKTVIDKYKTINLTLIMSVAIATTMVLSIFVYDQMPQPKNELEIIKQMSVDEKVEQVECKTLPKIQKYVPNQLFDEIKKRKILRLGLLVTNMPPVAYRSDINGKLIGYEVQLAHLLAKDMGCDKIEYYALTYDNYSEALENRQVDLLLNMYISNERLLKHSFTIPYGKTKQVLLLSDDLNVKLHKNPQILESPKFKIATRKYVDDASFKQDFPNVQNVKIENLEEFINNPNLADAAYASYEIAMGYCMRYPQYGVYEDIPQEIYPVALGIAYDEDKLRDYLNGWIAYQKESGKLDYYYNYWILGKSVVKKHPRKCLIPYDWYKYKR